jgi:hypothetical protein
MVYILLGSDDYVSRQILGVYNNRANAEKDITDKVYETAESSPRLICRQGEPHYEIVEKGVKP